MSFRFSHPYLALYRNGLLLNPLTELLASIVKTEELPSKKYKFPQTASQELGWHAHEKQEKKAPRKYYKGRVVSDVTKYADAFVSMQKVSPFSNKV